METMQPTLWLVHESKCGAIKNQSFWERMFVKSQIDRFSFQCVCVWGGGHESCSSSGGALITTGYCHPPRDNITSVGSGKVDSADNSVWDSKVQGPVVATFIS